MPQDKPISLLKTVDPKADDDSEATAVRLEERETDELVIALVGPVGSGVSTTGDFVAKGLKDLFDYDVEIIGVSDLIEEALPLLGVEGKDHKTIVDRIRFLQQQGTALRAKFGEKYLASKCISKITIHRAKSGGIKEIGNEKIQVPRRQAYIIDSLKHPSEIIRLREVYGDIFWVFGIFAPEKVRLKRLLGLTGIEEAEAKEIIKIDEEEGPSHGQRVRDTIQASDYFVRNDEKNRDRLAVVILRYLKILFGVEVVTPLPDETAMYNAAAAAAGSACLSRQVGAAIYSVEGELIGKGRNDVPKFKGGLYGYQDGEKDNRCYKWKEKICHNDAHKERLYQQIFFQLSDSGLLKGKKSKDFNDVKTALKSTDIKDLVEFSRAVHAEMDALICVARGAKSGLIGGTLYCTTFPCHSCARHIVASGITRVVYVEPYPKSLAITLHEDAITSLDQEDSRVKFLQYEGVAPKNILRLFGNKKGRKKDGKAVEIDPKKASPASHSPLDSFLTREQIVLKELERVEGAV